MSEEEVVTRHEPFDKLTHLAAKLTDPLDDPEYADIKAIVFLTDDVKGGIQIHGYEEQMDAIVDLFVHLKAMFNSIGKDLQLIPIPDSPEGLDGS